MLTLLLVLPLAVPAVLALSPPSLSPRRVSSFAAFSLFAYSAWLLLQFDPSTAALQFSEYHRWIDPIGLSYSLGVDGLSLPLIVLTTLLTWVAILCSPLEQNRSKFYYSLIFLATAGMIGALAAQNLLLFFLFYELEIIPFFFLISIWGSGNHQYAAFKFLLYTAVSGVLILVAFFGLAWAGEGGSFDFASLDLSSLGLRTKLILLTLVLVGFGIKVPIIPVHTWQPDVYVAASPAVAMLLGGVLAKLGTYGLVRFGLQLFPETWTLVGPGIAVIGSVSVIYGSMSAIAQKDIKRMVAYSSIGHMGYIIVAAAAGTTLSTLGAVAQMIAHGLILALLFHLVGLVEAKAGTRDLDKLNGLMNPVRGLPLTSALLVLAGMASAGIPGLVGFAAELLVFQGSFPIFPIPTIICILSSGLTAVYFVILINRTCFGRLDNRLAYYPKVTPSEQIPALILTVLIFVLGLQPNLLLRWTEATTTAMVAGLGLPPQETIALTAASPPLAPTAPPPISTPPDA
ncbi:MAG: NADH-quinone oxidoreductase subunit M [Prochlorothrix sp.]|nr:NADH-quinone oxidoreductase subunit M [Prochlorothrix sp.]